MRHNKVLLTILCALGLMLSIYNATAQIGLKYYDWPMHRGTNTRKGISQGVNAGLQGDIGITDSSHQLGRVWTWPPTGTMPAEIVVDNTILPVPLPIANATGQSFTVNGAWSYALNAPPNDIRAIGAWPPTDLLPDKTGDYAYVRPLHSAVLGEATAADPTTGVSYTTGTDVLAKLPNLGADVASSAIYKAIDAELAAAATYAQWSFGTQYPVGTRQGALDVGTRPLAANQRYAVYIRFPASGTTIGGAANANADHVMVRVSWGLNINDPITSRIFMLNSGQTGGFWMRVRTGAGDDRYFPYDGVHPVVVTLYNLVPDSEVTGKIIPADAVRLVPESAGVPKPGSTTNMITRGDIHDSAVSSMFWADGVVNPLLPKTMQLTYFGRDETQSPDVILPTLASYSQPGSFPAIPFNPTLAASAANPLIADPTTSMRIAAFYCMEDDNANALNVLGNNAVYGKLRWRYEARPTLQTFVVDDLAGAPGFTETPAAWTIDNASPTALNTSWASQFQTTPVVAAPQTANAKWTAQLPVANQGDGTTYSVYVWIPAVRPVADPDYTKQAYYELTTNSGVVPIIIDQHNPDPSRGAWRLLSSHVDFPLAANNLTRTAIVTLYNNAQAGDPNGDVTANRVVAADAVRFVAEKQATNGVMASPMYKRITWPSGITRDVVYFGTVDGHLWAMEGRGGTPLWVYPSVSNPAINNGNGIGTMAGLQDDPNYQPDLFNGRYITSLGSEADKRWDGGIYGIDGDMNPAVPQQDIPGSAGSPPYTVLNQAVQPGAFVSSPLYLEVLKGGVYTPMITVGNQNGRTYAFDPYGRVVDNPNMAGETLGEPYKATLNNNIPGTGRRWMTWPAVGRDKQLINRDYQFIDDSDIGFTAPGFAPVNPITANMMANKGSYYDAQATAVAANQAVATWTRSWPIPPQFSGIVPTYSIYVWIPAEVNSDFAQSANYTYTDATGVQPANLDQRNVLPPGGALAPLPKVGRWRLLASRVHLPSAAGQLTGTVKLTNLSAGDAGQAPARRMAADAVMFVSDFTLDDQVVNDSDPAPQFTMSPDPTWFKQNGVYTTTPGVSGVATAYATWKKTLKPPAAVKTYTVFVSLPAGPNPKFTANAHYQIVTATGTIEVYLNQSNPGLAVNGGWYFLKGGVQIPQDTNGNYFGQVSVLNDVSQAEAAAGVVVVADGVRFIAETTGAPIDDPAKGVFAASPTIHMDNGGSNDRIITGNGDGHIYALNMQNLNTHTRQTTLNWQFPDAADTTTKIDSVLLPGALSDTNSYIFSGGGRVYSITNPDNVTPALSWQFPLAGTPAETLSFTAPVWQINVPKVNTNKEVVFVANQDGKVYELDGLTGVKMWNSQTYGATRSSLSFVQSLPYQNGFITTPKCVPAVFLPLDTGLILGMDVTDTGLGKVIWGFLDARMGYVPLTDTSGTSVYPTGYAWRGADAITSNQWLYQGDEGNQDSGEVHGQMHAYYDTTQTTDYYPPDEPVFPEGPGAADPNAGVDIRIAEMWDSTTDVAGSPWDNFGKAAGGVSPYDAWRTNTFKKNNVKTFIAYEWGDTLYVAAWGAYANPVDGSNKEVETLPNVTITISGAGTTQTQTAKAVRDEALPAAPGVNVWVLGPAGNPAPHWKSGHAWFAKVGFPLGRGSEVFPQTPGSTYTITAQASQPATAWSQPTQTIMIQPGQYTLTAPNFADGSGTAPDPPEVALLNAPALIANGTGRNLTIAHPLALSTSGPNHGYTSPNTLGSVADMKNAANESELLANGNRIALITGATIGSTTLKDVLAPVGFVPHGNSAAYRGVDNNGAPQLNALAIADRSNLFKIGQTLNNVRVDRREMRWGYKPTDAAFGVMNPLPWEDLINIPTHTSVDYPDISRVYLSMRVNSVDMSQKSAALLPAYKDQNANKQIRWQPISLVVNVPKYQPANINKVYQDINGTIVNAIYSPMNVSTGLTVDPATSGKPLSQLASPSAGYVAGAVIFLDTAGTGRFRGKAGLEVNQQGATDAQSQREMAFRQFNVGVSVPPDLNMAANEETLDLGKAPHSLGYSPGDKVPFEPTGVGAYTASISPWDDPTGQVDPSGNAHRFFLPFTVINRGNVNLVNLLVAKQIGLTGPNPVLSPARLMSDQVPISKGVGSLWAGAYNTAGPNAVGNIGVISSLDHGGYAWDAYKNLWPIPNNYFPGNQQPQPTIHKPHVGDSSGTVMFLQDGPSGFQSGGKPRIGVAVPLGTPVGTYHAPIYVYEDHIPLAWRNWITDYSTWNKFTDPLANAQDDGVLNTPLDSNNVPTLPAIETTINNPFTLKITVREARLTNGFTFGSWRQLDSTPINPLQGPFMGGNIQPTANMSNDPAKNDIQLFWAGNRQPQGGAYKPPAGPTDPWNILSTRLNSVVNQNANAYDWRFSVNSWWDDVLSPMYTNGAQSMLAPQLTTDSTDNTLWLFWQGVNYDTNNMMLSNLQYVRLLNGAPDPAYNGGKPVVLPGDSSLPKNGLHPLIVKTSSGTRGYLFWHSGPAGRTRIYYNYNRKLKDQNKDTFLIIDKNDANSRWSDNTVLPTPGTLQWQADPTPVPRYLGSDPTVVTNIDLVFTGMLPNRRQTETLLTRYYIDPANGQLVIPVPGMDPDQHCIPGITLEQLARDGVSQTWVSRELAWVQRDNPQQTIKVYIKKPDVLITGVINEAWPTLDPATGKFVANCKWNGQGGQIILDTQGGAITFTGIAPGVNDIVYLDYTPRTMRLNVTRNSNAVMASAGSNSEPTAFLDMMQNPHPEAVLPLTSPATSMPVTRYWLLYRKSNLGAGAPSTIYYKTLRLMIRLPHGVLRNDDGTINDPNNPAANRQNIIIQNNAGPVEVDWVRGRVYFTQADEGKLIRIQSFFKRSTDNKGNVTNDPPDDTTATVQWQDEISTASNPSDQTPSEVALPVDQPVNEGSISAFKDPFSDRVWIFWSSTRSGIPDIYYMTISPQFYLQPAS